MAKLLAALTMLLLGIVGLVTTLCGGIVIGVSATSKIDPDMLLLMFAGWLVFGVLPLLAARAIHKRYFSPAPQRATNSADESA